MITLDTSLVNAKAAAKASTKSVIIPAAQATKSAQVNVKSVQKEEAKVAQTKSDNVTENGNTMYNANNYACKTKAQHVRNVIREYYTAHGEYNYTDIMHIVTNSNIGVNVGAQC